MLHIVVCDCSYVARISNYTLKQRKAMFALYVNIMSSGRTIRLLLQSMRYNSTCVFLNDVSLQYIIFDKTHTQKQSYT